MPTLIIEIMLWIVFVIPLIAGVLVLVLGGTWMQVQDRKEEQYDAPKRYRRRRAV